ncbi:MAG TPA: copper transporter [Intrasporangium sp.]|uniref:copper transporter n=1 Tax=Intrasporangium sp. TaxID=1925024 RepID=UPI002D7712C6|nr:copper transporter [Intrasporangium sp.]HET7396912.1 copper transporter [Intrasporangium sp.]
MIDFRYHLVSIISIFLALAVGIVLGAGPLQAGLGSTLGDQVTALRAEKQDLNAKLDATEKLAAASGEYAGAVGDRVVRGRLNGHHAVLVVLPSADDRLVTNLQATLATAGAPARGTVTLANDWFEPTRAADRASAAGQAAGALGVGGGLTGDPLLRQVLARLVTPTAEGLPAPARAAALKILSGAGLLDSSAPDLAAGDLVVVVSGAFTGEDPVVARRAEAVRALVAELAAPSRAAVVVGGAPVTAAGQPAASDAVAAVRADAKTKAVVSTVDHATEPSGPATVVLALESELDEQTGHYGTSPGATATVPKVRP